MVPNYSRAKEASISIMNLNARQSKIDPNNENQGIILVSFYSLKQNRLPFYPLKYTDIDFLF